MSIWAEFGFSSADDVAENPFSVPLDEYDVNVEAEVKPWKEGGEPFFIISYTIMNGAYAGLGANRSFPLKPFTSADDPDWQSKNKRTISGLKRALIELGLNAEQINAFKLTPEYAKAISGIKGRAKIGPQKSNPEYNSVSSFSRNNVGAPSVSNTPSAPDFVQQAVAAPAGNGPVSGAANNSFANLFPGVG